MATHPMLAGIIARIKPHDEEEEAEAGPDNEGLEAALEDLADALEKIRSLSYQKPEDRKDVDEEVLSAAKACAARAFRNAFLICESEPHEEAHDEGE